MAASPCRLFVYLAREAPLGVVLRRGPSDWARLSVWHTESDTFEHGQWIKGRVYERRSDVSADGSLFAAFIRQSGGRAVDRPNADSWVAVSRPPWFTALAVWFVGGTYHTGAFFPERNALWVGFMEQPPDIGRVPRWLSITKPRDIPYIDGTNEWTDRTVHFNRLLRDGWERVEDSTYRTKWERSHPGEPLTLLMTQQFEDFRLFGGPYVVDYGVRLDGGREHTIGQATWADWDRRGRLVIARDGKLLEWEPGGSLREIADFNAQAPEPEAAPARARAWPRRLSPTDPAFRRRR